MQRYQELRVWNEAHTFLLAVYRLTAALPAEERYGLASQLRRAALSVPTNIVEGSTRIGRPDFVRFLNLSEASLAEAQYLLVVCRDLGYVAATLTDPLISTAPRIARMLYALRSRVTSEDIDRDRLLDPGRGGRDTSPEAPGAASPARAAEADGHGTAGKAAVVRSSQRARRACLARSERRR
jgi:four helix bundle protein